MSKSQHTVLGLELCEPRMKRLHVSERFIAYIDVPLAGKVDKLLPLSQPKLNALYDSFEELLLMHPNVDGDRDRVVMTLRFDAHNERRRRHLFAVKKGGCLQPLLGAQRIIVPDNE